eukprot:comp13092_c0_seq1/m.17741 comp13092_c0_seq1/g.17741  ORF comp13092_c0_seq1/g.17741 comp13092_c0_seq1/m.17741 type:complete len:200 (-) comp13092_c0_seq1:71-670(-)
MRCSVSFVFALCLLAGVLAYDYLPHPEVRMEKSADASCTYTAPDGSYYDLSSISNKLFSEKLLGSSPSSGTTFNFAICNSIAAVTNAPGACAGDSAVCATDDSGKTTSFGSASSSGFASNNWGKGSGVFLIYNFGDACASGPGGKRTVNIQIGCSSFTSTPWIAEIHDGCTASLFITSPAACPQKKPAVVSSRRDISVN